QTFGVRSSASRPTTTTAVNKGENSLKESARNGQTRFTIALRCSRGRPTSDNFDVHTTHGTTISRMSAYSRKKLHFRSRSNRRRTIHAARGRTQVKAPLYFVRVAAAQHKPQRIAFT